MKIISWNVNGIRAVMRKGLFEYMVKEDADVYCLQETKIHKDLVDSNFDVEGYHKYFNSAERKGYSGVACYTKKEPLSVTYGLGIEKFDVEGRVLTLEFDKFFLINCYFPNANHELSRLDYKLEFNKELERFASKLKEKKGVIITGDFNVAHKEIDLKNPKNNRGNPGFTDEERKSFSDFLSKGYVDVFREFDKSPEKYTWWSYRFNARARNIGWRIDYFVVNKEFLKHVKDSKILDCVKGSDHCPVFLEVV